jgi:catechol 2,3-dioxygenase-like lactoylglutathione lyase family enzyme
MRISRIIPQLRTTDVASSIDFYTAKLGFTLDFRYEDFYAGVRAGDFVLHLKQIDAPDSVDRLRRRG